MADTDLPKPDDLPPVLRRIAEVAGVVAAVQLARDYGGTEIYIRKKLDSDHVLVRSVGMRGAELILDALGAGVLEVPMGPNCSGAQLARAIAERHRAGQSEREIARALRCHIRTVRRHRAKLPSPQPDLFAMGSGTAPDRCPDGIEP